MDFDAITKAIRERMAARDIHEEVIEEFLFRVGRVHQGYLGKIPWSEIGDLPASDYARLEDLPAPADPAAALDKLVIIKLNGGLGTSMGLSRVKSIIPVKTDASFLDIILNQLRKLRARFDTPIPLMFMNSFNTREDTLAAAGVADMNKEVPGEPPADFLQNIVPRIHADDLLPLGDGSSSAHWCPPGHGDIFLSLKITGILDKLLESGRRVAFISNGDNLGATFDERILDYFLREKLEFASEVTPKTKADLKGGVLYKPADGSARIELLETAQVPDEHISDFQDVERFAYFNINNLWVNLEALRDRLAKGDFRLSLIRNPKTVEDREILQLETAMGSAVGRFNETRVIIVPRTRFAPVKNCMDLLVRRSDVYLVREEDGALVMNPARTLGEPVVRLDDNYKKLDDFNKLVPVPPSLVHCARLEVEGPVLFDEAVEIKGEVVIKNSGTEPVSIKAAGKTVLENCEINLG